MATKLYGKIKGVKPKFCIVQGEDGNEYYLGNKDMQNRSFTVGTSVSFTGSKGERGLYAEDVIEVESPTPQVKGKPKGKPKAKVQADARPQSPSRNEKGADKTAGGRAADSQPQDSAANPAVNPAAKSAAPMDPQPQSEPEAKNAVTSSDGPSEDTKPPAEVVAPINEASAGAPPPVEAATDDGGNDAENNKAVDVPKPTADVPAEVAAAPALQAEPESSNTESLIAHAVDVSPPKEVVTAPVAAVSTEQEATHIPAATTKTDAPVGVKPSASAGVAKPDPKPTEPLQGIPPAPAEEAGCCLIS